MIDFERIVSTLLLEAEPDPTPTNQTTNATDRTVEYFINPKGNSPYEKFAAEFQKKYGRPPLSSPQDIQRLIVALKGSSNKNELTISNFTDYIESFPLIDFVLFVTTLKGNTKSILGDFEDAIQTEETKTSANGKVEFYIKDFVNNKAIQDGWPLDYPAKTYQARLLEIGLRKKLADNVVGTLALEQQYQKSIYDAVLTLLAGREKIRNSAKTVPSSNKFINEILYGSEQDFKKYAGGGAMVQGKYARMWDQVSVERLMELGNSIRNFYNQQKAEHASVKSTAEEGAATPSSVPTLEQFVKNNIGGKAFSWTVAENLSFDDVFSRYLKEMLLLERESWFKLGDGKTAKVHSDETKKVIKFTIVDKLKRNMPDSNYEPIYITPSDLLNIYNNNTDVQQEVAQYRIKQNKQFPQFNSDKDALFSYFASAKGDNSTEEKHLDKAINNILQQRLKSALADRAKNRSKSSATADEPLPESGYIIKYIASLTGNDSAKDLITKLKLLGDYIAEEQPPNWKNLISGIGTFASGASMGVPDVGGKRA
jgi:hypothetical protein